MSGDQVVITVTYSVNGYVVSTKVYIWTLYIPTPELVTAVTDPGEAAPAFESGVYLYNLTLPVGTESTSYTLTKTPGVLNSVMVHRRPATSADIATICTDCAYDQVRGIAMSCNKRVRGEENNDQCFLKH